VLILVVFFRRLNLILPIMILLSHQRFIAIVSSHVRPHSLKPIIKAKDLVMSSTMAHVEGSFVVLSFRGHVHSIVLIMIWHSLDHLNRKFFYFVDKSSLNVWQNDIFIYIIRFIMIFIKYVLEESLIKWICTCFFFTIFLMMIICIRHLRNHRIMLCL